MSRRHIDRAAERLARLLLVDVCTIHRPDDDGTLNPVTLSLTDSGTQVFEGACFVNFRPGDAGADFVTIEALGRTDTKTRVRLPLTCPTLLYGDLITIDESDNDQLAGAELEVLDDSTGTYAVSKIVRCRFRGRIK